MATVVKDLGAVTAYAYAVEGGYTGTEADFEDLLGNIAEDLSEIENLSVTVTTLPAGSSATASYSNGVLSLGIPKGDKGDTGATPNFSIGTVTTGEAGSSASATITGTDEAPVLNLTIPRGDPGEVNAMSIASAYSSSSTYAVGDYVFYNGSLYRCTTAITTAEAWTAAHWTAAVLGDDVGDLKSAYNKNLVYDGSLGVSNFVRKTLLAASGAENASTTRLSSSFLSPIGITYVKPKTGYKVMLYAYSQAYSYVGIWNGTSFVKVVSDNNWTTVGRDISALPQNYLYRVLLAKAGDETIEPKDCGNAIFTFTSDSYGGDLIPISYDPDSDDMTINASGEIVEYTGYHYTNQLPVDNGVYHFTFSFISSTNYNIRIHGYDTSGTWVSQVVGETHTRDGDMLFAITDPTIKYIRIACSKQVLNEKLFPQVNVAEAVNTKVNNYDFDAVKYGIAKGGMSDLMTANAICRCAQSYLDHNSDFVYKGFSGSAVRLVDDGVVDTDTGKFKIDCSSFALLVLMGVDFDSSRYNLSNTTNKIGAMGYGFNPFWGQTYPWSIPHEASGTYTWMMCRDYANMGCTVDIVGRDFSGVQPGDLLFWGSTTESGTEGRYKRIRHVDVVLGRVGEKDALLADAGQVPITVHLASARTATDDIAVVARLPLGPAPKNTLNTICEKHSPAITTKTYSVSGVAKYTPVAVKFRVSQTLDSGLVKIVDSSNETVYQSDNLNAGTNGKTFDIIGRGFVPDASITSLTVQATGCEILESYINYPASYIEDTTLT